MKISPKIVLESLSNANNRGPEWCDVILANLTEAEERRKYSPFQTRRNYFRIILLVSLALVLFVIPVLALPSASAAKGVTTLCSALFLRSPSQQHTAQFEY
jgi:hypothetical protein